MKCIHRVLTTVICLALLLIPGPAGLKAVVPNVDQGTVVAGNTAFALNLYQRLGRNFKAANIVFSPYSISIALAMTYAGARGQTKAQMAKALGFSLPDDRFHAAFGRLGRTIMAGQGGADKGWQLNIANALWPQKGYPFLNGFLNVINRNYGRGLFPLDYRGNPEQARKTINDWVAKKTKDKIMDLIPRGAIKTLTRLVLTNAIYFKGTWLMKFDKAKTIDAPFHLLSGKKVGVKMMRLFSRKHIRHLRYGRFDGLEVLEMPYAGKALSMLILLPTKVDGLAALERSLTPAKLSIWLVSLRPRKVREVWLPRFKITTPTINLKKVLRAMGMVDAFSQARADFSGLTGNRDLYITGAFHKAFIEVNEQGAEAAAATAVVVGLKSMPARRLAIFKADRPFIFLIHHRRTGAILFMGRVRRPHGS